MDRTPKERVKLTPKQRVIRKFPKAEFWRWEGGGLCGIDYRGCTIGTGTHARAAWQDAARRLK